MIINFVSSNSPSKDIVFCCLDITHKLESAYPSETIKNISDYTISNITLKGFNVIQGLNENLLLKEALRQGYKYAVFYTTGTEFINGDQFFKNVKELISEDFFLAGHILDRGDAYYELHYQCYILNLKKYKKIGCPDVGDQDLGNKHIQNVPWRSKENYHDNYTPVWVSGGDDTKLYHHKCHGWNILRLAFEKDLRVVVFNESIRNNKRYHYPEKNKTFDKHLPWINWRYNYCANSFIHHDNNETGNHFNIKFNHLILPASGFLYENLIDQGMITFYDYNLSALEYYKKQKRKSGIEYRFVHIDLLGNDNLDNLIDLKYADSTLVNLSNIFCYEGTASHIGLRQRLYKENQILSLLKDLIPNSHVNMTAKSYEGFGPSGQQFLQLREFTPMNLEDLITPTWHVGQDWS